MDWKEIEWQEPPKTLPQAIGGAGLEKSLLQAFFGDAAKEQEVLEYLASNWTALGGQRSLPVALQKGVLTVHCLSASARQNLVLRFPAIQKDIKHRFQFDISQMRFEQKQPDIAATTEKVRKIEEPTTVASDTVKSESDLIRDIRRILGL